MKSGDRVTVTVRGERVPATVVTPYTALGHVQVVLDVPEDVAGIIAWNVVRARADVESADELEGTVRRCEECRGPWADLVNGQCPRCGNRTWEIMLADRESMLKRQVKALLVEYAPREPTAVNAAGETVSLDTPMARAAAKLFNVPDAAVGIPTPWWRRWWQRHVTRRP